MLLARKARNAAEAMKNASSENIVACIGTNMLSNIHTCSPPLWLYTWANPGIGIGNSPTAPMITNATSVT